jgi:hypothetical protein
MWKNLYPYCPFGKCRCSQAFELIDWNNRTITIPKTCQSCDKFFLSFDLEYVRKFFKENNLCCITEGFV